MKETLQYWDDRALENKDARSITHYDIHQRQFEIEFISKYLKKDQSVLEIGCGNGYTTGIINSLIANIKAIDFSPEMINRAKKEVSGENIEFTVGDVRNLNIDKQYDVIITQRCLINILSWEMQQEGLLNIAKCLKPGGIFIMFEGSADGKRNLNTVRKTFGLKEIPKVEYNLDFEEQDLRTFMKDEFDLLEKNTFGQYEYITRVIYPLSIAPEDPQYESKFHDIALKSVQTLKDSHPDISKLAMWVWKKQ